MAERSDANRISLYYIEETTWGTTPSTPTLDELQVTSITGGHKKQTVIPTTIRPDRMQESLVRVGENAESGFSFELRHTQYDEFIAALLAATDFTTVTISANTDISAAATDDSFNRTTGSFVSDGIVAGMFIKVSGFSTAADNGIFEVLTVAALKITVNAALTDDAGGEAVTITAKMVRNGVARRSFTIEQRFNDITQYQAFTGMRVGQLDLTMNNRSIITGTFSLMGRQGVPSGTSVATALTPAASNPAMDTSNNIISIVENGVVLATPVLNMSLTINNNIGIQPAISERFPIGIRYGVLEVTGRMEIYFEDLVLLNKFINHTATSLRWEMQDDNGKSMYITLPRIFFSEGDTPVTGQNSDIIIALPFQASFSDTYDNVIQVDIFS